MSSLMWRYKIDKKVGLNTYHLRYGKGCMCSWLKMELRIPDEVDKNKYIAELLKKL